MRGFAALFLDRLFALAITVAAILLVPVGLAAKLLLTPWWVAREVTGARRHRSEVAARRCPDCGATYGPEAVRAAFAAAREERQSDIAAAVQAGRRPRVDPMIARVRCPGCGGTAPAGVR